MKKVSALLIINTIVIALLFGTSCNKEEDTDTTTNVASDNALATDMFDDVFKQVDEGAQQEAEVNKWGVEPQYHLTSGSCVDSVDVTTTNGGFPKTLTIYFGTNNDPCSDGRTRKGNIIAVFDGRWDSVGTKVTVTLDNYYVNDYHVEGTKTISHSASNPPTYEVNVTGGKITASNGNVTTWETNTVRTWIEGANTNIVWAFGSSDSCSFWTNGFTCILDDVWQVEGTTSGTSWNGMNFSGLVTSPLKVRYCSYIPEVTDGVVTITPESGDDRVVDFGNGTCDRKADVTIGSWSGTINW